MMICHLIATSPFGVCVSIVFGTPFRGHCLPSTKTQLLETLKPEPETASEEDTLEFSYSFLPTVCSVYLDQLIILSLLFFPSYLI